MESIEITSKDRKKVKITVGDVYGPPNDRFKITRITRKLLGKNKVFAIHTDTNKEFELNVLCVVDGPYKKVSKLEKALK